MSTLYESGLIEQLHILISSLKSEAVPDSLIAACAATFTRGYGAGFAQSRGNTKGLTDFDIARAEIKEWEASLKLIVTEAVLKAHDIDIPEGWKTLREALSIEHN